MPRVRYVKGIEPFEMHVDLKDRYLSVHFLHTNVTFMVAYFCEAIQIS